MPRPKGMDRESRADLFYLWAIGAAFAICALVGLHLAFTFSAGAQTVNRGVRPVAGCTGIGVLARDVSKRFPGQETRRLEGNEAAAFMAARTGKDSQYLRRRHAARTRQMHLSESARLQGQGV